MIGMENFGHLIRNRRRQLDMTQEEVARLIGTSVAYITHLEKNKRHPSKNVVLKLAEALGLEARELFFLANPGTKLLVSQEPKTRASSAWEAFARDDNLRRVHNISDEEMKTLSQVAMMGEVRSSRDFVFILHTIRQALGG